MNKFQEYLTKDGTFCPFCESTDITGGPLQIDGGSVWQDITCGECNAEWKDVYFLRQIETTEGLLLATIKPEIPTTPPEEKLRAMRLQGFQTEEAYDNYKREMRMNRR